MTEKEKPSSIKLDSQTMTRLRLLSDLSGYSIAYLVREFSKLADLILPEYTKVNIFFGLKKEQLYLSVMLLPQVEGSFLVTNETTDSEVDKRIKKESMQKLGIKEDD